MRTTSDEASEAIGLIEAADQLLAKINDLRSWPGLSGAQRAAAMVMLCVQHADAVEGTPPADIAALLAISQTRAEALFDGVEHPPFELVSVGGGRPLWQPSQRLEYGE